MLTLWEEDREAPLRTKRRAGTILSCVERAEQFRRRCKDAGGYLRMDLGRTSEAHILESLEEITAVIDYFLYHTRNPFLHIDIESKNLNNMRSKRGSNSIATIQLCDDGENAYIIPVNHPESPWAKWKPKYKRRALKLLRREITRLFTTPKPAFKRWTAHFAQFEDTQLYTWMGIRPTNRPMWCTRHAAHLANENRLETDRGRAFGLKPLVADYCDYHRYEEADLVVRKSGKLYRLPMKRLAWYGAMDVWVPDRLLKVLIAKAKKEGFKDDYFALLDGLMAPTVKVEAHLKRSGFRVNLDFNLELLRRGSPIEGRLSEAKRELYATDVVKKCNAILVKRRQRDKLLKPLFKTPWVFNVRKKAHRALLFFVVMDLEPRPLNRKEMEEGKPKSYDPELAKLNKYPPMDKAFLALHASSWNGKDEVWENNLDDEQNPLHMAATLYKEIVGLNTLRNLFVKKIWKEFVRPSNPHANCVDGHTRSTYDFAATVTGRGASRSPNGQQNPRADTPVKKKVKNLYVSERGWVLVPMDFRANEVRWGCLCSGDTVLAKLLIDGEAAMEKYRNNPTKRNKAYADIASDIHKQTAGVVFNIPNIYTYDWSTMEAKRRRNGTKAVIFGIFFGRGANAIAAQLGIDPDEAKELIQKIRSRFIVLFEWLDSCMAHAREYGYVRSPFGRRRRLAHMYQHADIIDSVKERFKIWKAEEVAGHIEGLTVGECKRAQAKIAEAGRLAKNSPIQSVASDANNLGTFELLTTIEPELEPLSALTTLYPDRVHPSYSRFQSHASDAMLNAQASLKSGRVEDVFDRIDRLKTDHAEAQRYLKACKKRANPWKVHSVVHDSAYVGCHVDDIPKVVEVMEDCFVTRASDIAANYYGVNMIAPLAVEFEFGLSAGDCVTWDWTEDHLAQIMDRLRKEVAERDSKQRIRPLVDIDHSNIKCAA